MNKKLDIIVDFEADNLMPFAERIWCGTVKIVGKPEDEEASYRTIMCKNDLLKIIPHVRYVINHNILGYDLPLARKVWEIPFTVGADGNDTWNGHPVTFVDTLHMSQFLNPDRLDGHSLGAWGKRVGLEKGEHNDWSQFSEEMLQYNRKDTTVNDRVYRALLTEAEQHQ